MDTDVNYDIVRGLFFPVKHSQANLHLWCKKTLCVMAGIVVLHLYTQWTMWHIVEEPAQHLSGPTAGHDLEWLETVAWKLCSPHRTKICPHGSSEGKSLFVNQGALKLPVILWGSITTCVYSGASLYIAVISQALFLFFFFLVDKSFIHCCAGIRLQDSFGQVFSIRSVTAHCMSTFTAATVSSSVCTVKCLAVDFVSQPSQRSCSMMPFMMFHAWPANVVSIIVTREGLYEEAICEPTQPFSHC